MRSVTFHPLTPDRWKDVEALFGPRGACAGCFDPRRGRAPDAFVYTGIASAFTRAGFTEVVRRSETRPVMRRSLRRAGDEINRVAWRFRHA